MPGPSRGGKGSGRSSDAPLSTLRSVQGLHRDEIPCDDLLAGEVDPISNAAAEIQFRVIGCGKGCVPIKHATRRRGTVPLQRRHRMVFGAIVTRDRSADRKRSGAANARPLPAAVFRR